MVMTSPRISSLAIVFAVLAFCTSAPRAGAETIILGQIGAGSTIQWPIDIAREKGFFKKHGVELDIVTVASNSTLQQQVASGSLNIGFSAGATDPVRAGEKGAPLVILRIDCLASPYALVTKADIGSMQDLKGKTISLDSAKGITRAYFDRVAAASGLKHDDFDYVYQGATPARFAALKSGAAAGALLTSPFNFFAEAEGFKTLVVVQQVVKDLPFTVSEANKAWALAHKDLIKKYLAAYNEGVAWFYDPNNRAEAIKIKLAHSKMRESDIEKSYDFYQKLELFNKSDTVSKTLLRNIMDVLVGFGDLQKPFPVDELIVPDITKVVE
jgi:ABC-type nitrate/sulfonate/bicarbonate transport system substrate-binding protein